REAIHNVAVLAHRPARHWLVDERTPKHRRERGEPIRRRWYDLAPHIAHFPLQPTPTMARDRRHAGCKPGSAASIGSAYWRKPSRRSGRNVLREMIFGP